MRSRPLVSGLTIAIVLAMQFSEGSAQQGGTVSGRVLDLQTGAPLAAVQVFIDALDFGGLTQQNGRYLLQNVPAGTHTLAVARIGYRTEEAQITVGGGQTVEQNFDMAQVALALDEIIVTGTPGGTQRRAIGNDVVRLDVAASIQEMPTVNLQGALKAQAPGVMIMPQNGSVGSGASIRIRGNNSFTLSNEPIVYIDGVRMDATPYGGNRGRNPINEIDPEQIASIEIIKGPAAATLYGTEASGGVIQILTKRGTQGAPVVDMSMQLGVHYLSDPAGKFGMTYARDAAGALYGFNIYEQEAEFGKGPIFQDGLLQSYNVSVTGGSERIRYFATLGADDNMGIITRDYQWQTMYSARLNLGATLHETLNAEFSMGVVRNNIKEISTSVQQHFTSAIWAQPSLVDGPTRGFHALPPEASELIDRRQEIDRTLGSLQLTHTPTPWLTQRLTAGVDLRNAFDFSLWPRQPADGINGDGARFGGGRANGQKTTDDVRNQLVTVDYAVTLDYDVTESLNTQTSFGGQYYQKKEQSRGSLGLVFPTGVVTTISGAATTSADEDFVENVTAGVYIQEQLGWNDRLFLTGAVRWDDNSAFGENFDAAVYPKLSGTWVISEEDFFDVGMINQLRLRSAWGKSGRQPDIFAAQRFYDPNTGPGGVSVLTPGTIGNPDLKPETSSEIEVGADLSMFDDRLSASFTYYDRTTKDAILNAGIPTSLGFPGSQSINAGEVKAWGTELQIGLDIVTTNSFAWNLVGTYSTMENEIVDLGGLTSIQAGRSTSDPRTHREGASLADLWWFEVTSAEYSATGQIQNAMCRLGQDDLDTIVPCVGAGADKVNYGHTYPQWEVGIQNSFRVGQDLRVSARVDFQGGAWGVNHDHLATVVSFANTFHAVTPATFPIYDSYRSLVGRPPLGFFRRDFGKLRSVSATYSLPDAFTNRAGLDRASITVAGDNLWTFWFPGKWMQLRNTDYIMQGPDDPVGGSERAWDPEMEPVSTTFSGNFLSTLPPTRRFTTTLRVTFR